MDVKKIAQEALSLSELSVNRTVIKLDELVNMNRITIYAAEPVTIPDMNGEMRDTFVLMCEEKPDNFFYANTLLCKIFTKLLEYTEGDLSELNEALSTQPLVVRLSMTKTKKGMPLTMVELL